MPHPTPDPVRPTHVLAAGVLAGLLSRPEQELRKRVRERAKVAGQREPTLAWGIAELAADIAKAAQAAIEHTDSDVRAEFVQRWAADRDSFTLDDLVSAWPSWLPWPGHQQIGMELTEMVGDVLEYAGSPDWAPTTYRAKQSAN